VSDLAASIESNAKATLLQFEANRPRSLQPDVGMSELGGCPRRLGYRILGVAKSNKAGDPLAPFIGGAGHAALADMYEAENQRLGRVRYLIEHRVEIPPYALGGNVDLVDLEADGGPCVIDHKWVGATTLKSARLNGPSVIYRWQIHTYAAALRYYLDVQVANVAIIYWPRTGFLRDMYTWSEPYDEAIVEQALSRLDSVRTITSGLGVDGLKELPTSDTVPCSFCPYWMPAAVDLTEACPGHAPEVK